MAVFPVRPRGKKPLTVNGFHDATTDPQQITEWWSETPDANIGLPLAANGLCAVDLDGPEGLAEWANLSADCPGPVSTATQTGSGGAHIIYAVPPGRRPRGTVGVFPSIDLRGPGYPLAPPSVHPNGTAYQWAMPPWRLAPQLAPGWVLEPEAPRTSTVPHGAETNGHSLYGRAALVRIVREVATARKGCRNHTLFAQGCQVAELVCWGHLEESEALEVLYLASLESGLAAWEANRTIGSAIAHVTGAGRGR